MVLRGFDFSCLWEFSFKIFFVIYFDVCVSTHVLKKILSDAVKQSFWRVSALSFDFLCKHLLWFCCFSAAADKHVVSAAQKSFVSDGFEFLQLVYFKYCKHEIKFEFTSRFLLYFFLYRFEVQTCRKCLQKTLFFANWFFYDVASCSDI